MRPGLKIMAVAVISASLLLYNGTSPLLGQGPPQPDVFVGEFLKEPFLILMLALVFWWIALIRKNPVRLEEYRLLNSLPLTRKGITDHFILQDLQRSSWLLALNLALVYGMASLAPLAHLHRIAVLSLLHYGSAIFLNMTLHSALAVFSKKIIAANPLSLLHPVLLLIVMLYFGLGELIIILVPEWATGSSFWAWFGLFAAVSLLLWQTARLAFSKWQRMNTIFLHPAKESAKSVLDTYQDNRFPVNGLDALLISNLLKILRTSNKAALVLTMTFVTLGYLVSRNNARHDDFLAVLLGISIFYSMIFAYRSMRAFSEFEQAPEIIYALPLSKRQVYASIFLPAFVWLAGIFSAFGFLSWIATSSITLAGKFWLDAMLAGTALLFAAVNYSLGHYPDLKKAQQGFAFWGLSLVILGALFYPYRILVLLLMTIYSIRPLQRFQFFRRTW